MMPPRVVVAAVLAIIGGITTLVAWDWITNEPVVQVEESVRTATPESVAAADLHRSPSDAAESRAELAGLALPRADRFVLIFADDASVQLRVLVTGDEGCRWIGVSGKVVDEAFAWYAGSEGTTCDEADDGPP